MLTKDGKNGYNETFWKLHVPAEHCGPGLEVGIVVGERGITIGGGLIAWADIDAARAELSAIKGGGEAVAEVSAETFSSDGTSDIITCNLPIGTKLYTRPPVVAEAEPVETEHNVSARAMWHTNCRKNRFGGAMKPTATGWECVACGAVKDATPASGAVPVHLRPVLAMILNALDRDAAEGRAVRGEMADELRTLLAKGVV